MERGKTTISTMFHQVRAVYVRGRGGGGGGEGRGGEGGGAKYNTH